MVDVILELFVVFIISFIFFVLSVRIAGYMEDIGRFSGLMKLVGEGRMLNALVILGEEKLFILLLNKILVFFLVIFELNLKNKIFVCDGCVMDV